MYKNDWEWYLKKDILQFASQIRTETNLSEIHNKILCLNIRFSNFYSFILILPTSSEYSLSNKDYWIDIYSNSDTNLMWI